MVLTFKTSASCILQETQKNVTGTVRVKLFKGHAIVEGRKSEYSLYDEKLATYTAQDEFNHDAKSWIHFIIWFTDESIQPSESKEGGSVSKLWGGRFTEEAEAWVEEFGASISFDRQLVNQDINGRAHVTMLAKQSIVTKEEAEKIKVGLQYLLKEAKENKLQFSVEAEDIHLNIEKMLIEQIGEVGGKLHTGRSRNDQWQRICICI